MARHGDPRVLADLRIGLTVAQEIFVGAVITATTVLEAARSQIAGTVSQPEVQSVPLNGRNFLELAFLIPGVSA